MQVSKVPVHAIETYMGGRRIDKLSIKLGTRCRWAVKFTPERTPVLFE